MTLKEEYERLKPPYTYVTYTKKVKNWEIFTLSREKEIEQTAEIMRKLQESPTRLRTESWLLNYLFSVVEKDYKEKLKELVACGVVRKEKHYYIFISY